jgi:hypothetical protein
MSILEEIKVNRTPTHVERQKLPGEVKQAENDLWQRPVYRPGDGDSMRQVPREGSLKAFSLPSRGNKT